MEPWGVPHKRIGGHRLAPFMKATASIPMDPSDRSENWSDKKIGVGAALVVPFLFFWGGGEVSPFGWVKGRPRVVKPTHLYGPPPHFGRTPDTASVFLVRLTEFCDFGIKERSHVVSMLACAEGRISATSGPVSGVGSLRRKPKPSSLEFVARIRGTGWSPGLFFGRDP